MPKRKNLVDVLRQAIRDSGLTPYRIAKDSGTSPDQITRFMHRERSMKIETLAAIADVLGLELTKRK